MENLTIKQAYLAMYLFLEGYYERTNSDDLAGLLGGFQLLKDGVPADSAAWQDWLEAINKIISEDCSNNTADTA